MERSWMPCRLVPPRIPPFSTRKRMKLTARRSMRHSPLLRKQAPPAFGIEQAVQTKDSAKQMVWDSKTNRILLLAAHFMPPTGAPRAGVAGYGGKMVPDSFSILVVSK